jgi:polar amino acid transport system substrate-binding protein
MFQSIQSAWQLMFVLSLLLVSMASAETPVWRCGWYPQPPFQFSARQGELETVTGLDVQLMRAITREAGHLLTLEEIPWERHLKLLKSGDCELAFGAPWTAERENFVRFSAPYRQEENALYVRISDMQRYPFKDAAAFLAQVRSDGLRLGVVTDTVYLLPEVDAFVRDPANARFLVASDTDAENLQALVQGDVDAALSERLSGATITIQLGYETTITEHPANLGAMGVCAMFSRVSTTEKDVEDFNRALHAVQASGEFDRILRGYHLSPMLEIAVGGRWFYWLDIIGTIAFALSGVILAHRGRYNLVGAFVLAALPAVGGGLLRDLITGRQPVGVLRSPVPLLLVAGLVVVGYVVFKLADRAPEGWHRSARYMRVFDTLFGFFDAVGLAAFTIMGVRVAVEMQCDPLWLWGPLLAVLTGAGGGVLRDIVLHSDNSALKRGLYAEVALVWGLALSLFLGVQVRQISMDQVRNGILVALLGALITRLIILYRGWENPLQFSSRRTRIFRR